MAQRGERKIPFLAAHCSLQVGAAVNGSGVFRIGKNKLDLEVLGSNFLRSVGDLIWSNSWFSVICSATGGDSSLQWVAGDDRVWQHQDWQNQQTSLETSWRQLEEAQEHAQQVRGTLQNALLSWSSRGLSEGHRLGSGAGVQISLQYPLYCGSPLASQGKVLTSLDQVITTWEGHGPVHESSGQPSNELFHPNQINFMNISWYSEMAWKYA